MTTAAPAFWTSTTIAEATAGRWLVLADPTAPAVSGISVGGRTLSPGEAVVDVGVIRNRVG